jgi:hypothetical protein
MPQLWYIIMVIKKSNTQFWYITMVFNFLKELNNYLENHHVLFMLVLSRNLLGFWGFWNYNQNSLLFYSLFSNTQKKIVFFSNVKNPQFFDLFFSFICTLISWLLKNQKANPHWFILMLVGCRFATRSKSSSKSKSKN